MMADVRAKMRVGSGRRVALGVSWLIFCFVLAFTVRAALGQEVVPPDEVEFGPAVRAYLGYLRAEQLVTDDRASRREVSSAYVRRNSNRVRALRQMAIRIARESGNDYLPELYAVTRDELGTLFEMPPRSETFREGEVTGDTFRFLGPVRTGELFYLFARLDVYEQAELLKKSGAEPMTTSAPSSGNAAAQGVKAATGDRPPNSAAQGDGARPADAQPAQPASRPRRVPSPTSTSVPPPAPKPAKQR
jgi:hypothetical protein